MDFNELLAHVLLGNPVKAWLYAALTLVSTAFALRLLLRYLAARLSSLAERTDTRVDDGGVDRRSGGDRGPAADRDLG